MARILIVDDEEGMRELLKLLLEREGYQVVLARNGFEALQRFQEGSVDLIITDLKMPKLNGLELLTRLKERHPSLLFLILTAYPSVESAVAAMKLGAFDYLTKPFRVEDLKRTIVKALGTANGKTSSALEEDAPLPGLIGESPKMKEVYRLIRKVAPLPSTVLIIGESGTGKELVARAIHTLSPRAGKPFLAINCGALSEHLLESELFGHVKGAFTGAVTHKAGLLEVADGGTLFLDEVSEMSQALQVKLLRFLQERTFRRVGGTEDVKVDVRVIAATNQDLRAAVTGGHFREDLYWRLNVIPIRLPPLRERKEDIPLLAGAFLDRFAKAQGKGRLTLLPETVELLKAYDWPGNVRELENVLERAVALASSDRITPGSLPDYIRNPGVENEQELSFPLPVDLETTLARVERSLLLQALERAGGIQKKAAELLGINFRSFRYRVKKHGLNARKKQGGLEGSGF